MTIHRNVLAAAFALSPVEAARVSALLVGSGRAAR